MKKILVIGSGPIVIGQACEFDYSGTQAVQVLRQMGYDVVIVNPNPASFMTTPELGARVYLEPLLPEYLEDIIRKERPDGILATLGGQVALNLAITLEEEGILERYGVQLLGTTTAAIRIAEDRGSFRTAMKEAEIPVPHSAFVRSLPEAVAAMAQFSFPLIIRPSFTLGGRGGRIIEYQQDFHQYVRQALHESPDHSVLIEESLVGWKEFELEVMRDERGNGMIVCSIENVDPMGIHTGDSITVAPVQTLSDDEYQKMRSMAIEVLRVVGINCGGANVQFAIDPENGKMVVIEMNPRVSRSSALASKTTGFPIARSAAQIAMGMSLDEILNEITTQTYACFEPALDYCAVKVPLFEPDKFRSARWHLGSQMKSVGESMCLGRSFIEALNKALRAVETGYDGLTYSSDMSDDHCYRIISEMRPERIHALYTLIHRRGESSLQELSAFSKIDQWFLHALWEQTELEKKLKLEPSHILSAKRMGISDQRIAMLTNKSVEQIFQQRKAHSIRSGYHFVDTCSGEFIAHTPYYYGSYGEQDEGTPLDKPAVIILGSGPNRIGQGLEFDTCGVLAVRAYRQMGVKTILINNNPETVSTDYNVADRLYIEPLVLESVREVIAKEEVRDIVVQLGGQTSLNMAEALEDCGARIVGTSLSSIRMAEDRGKFREFLQKLKLSQPVNEVVDHGDAIPEAARRIGFPVLIRPSYVLGGKAMLIARTEDQLHRFLQHGVVASPEAPVLVEQFLDQAKEFDLDAISDGENVFVAGVLQHVEYAGIHSGDSACSFPVHDVSSEVQGLIIECGVNIIRKLNIYGFCNIQFALVNDQLYVLEVNPRASRTVPFLSKATGVDLVKHCVALWQGQDLATQGLANGVGLGEARGKCFVKEATFSFSRFEGVDPVLGPEMRSTGESMGIGRSFGEAFSKASAAAGSVLPCKGTVYVAVNVWEHAEILPIVTTLSERGFRIAAIKSTAEFLYHHDILAEIMCEPNEGHPNVVDFIRARRLELVISTPNPLHEEAGSLLRQEALIHCIPHITTISASQAVLKGIIHLQDCSVTTYELSDVN